MKIFCSLSVQLPRRQHAASALSTCHMYGLCSRARRAALESKLMRMQEHRAARSLLLAGEFAQDVQATDGQLRWADGAASSKRISRLRARRLIVRVPSDEFDSTSGAEAAFPDSTEAVTVRFDLTVTATAFDRLLRRQLRLDARAFTFRTLDGVTVDPNPRIADGTELYLELSSPPPSPPSSDTPPSPPNSE